MMAMIDPKSNFMFTTSNGIVTENKTSDALKLLALDRKKNNCPYYPGGALCQDFVVFKPFLLWLRNTSKQEKKIKLNATNSKAAIKFRTFVPRTRRATPAPFSTEWTGTLQAGENLIVDVNVDAKEKKKKSKSKAIVEEEEEEEGSFTCHNDREASIELVVGGERVFLFRGDVYSKKFGQRKMAGKTRSPYFFDYDNNTTRKRASPAKAKSAKSKSTKPKAKVTPNLSNEKFQPAELVILENNKFEQRPCRLSEPISNAQLLQVLKGVHNPVISLGKAKSCGLDRPCKRVKTEHYTSATVTNNFEDDYASGTFVNLSCELFGSIGLQNSYTNSNNSLTSNGTSNLLVVANAPPIPAANSWLSNIDPTASSEMFGNSNTVLGDSTERVIDSVPAYSCDLLSLSGSLSTSAFSQNNYAHSATGSKRKRAQISSC